MMNCEAHVSNWQKSQLGITRDQTKPGLIKEDHKPMLDEIPEVDPKMIVEKSRKQQIDE